MGRKGGGEEIIDFSCGVSVVTVLRGGEEEEEKGRKEKGRRFYACLQAPCRKVQNDCEPGRAPRSIGVLCMRADVQ